FPVETLNTGGAYLLPNGAAALTGNQTTTVPLVALDDVNVSGRVRLIKMDVEGAEPQVVRGATRLITRDRPLILSELHPTQLARASGATPDAFVNQMHALGYRAQDLHGASIVRAPDGIAS